MIGLYAGSFDPPTLGHLDIVRRAAACCTRLVVAVGVNPEKDRPCLTVDERLRLLAVDAAAMTGSISFDHYQGATVRYARRIGAMVLIRGLRSYADLNRERAQAEINRREGFDTLFLLAETNHSNLSSSLVRQVMEAGLSLDGLVSPAVAAALAQGRG
jgi:pantetheine-phosphate adenylyltransferase